jgi:predicted nucleotidyltransferase
MIDLDQRYLTLIKVILAEHVPQCEVRVFGSRVNGSASKFSDLDLARCGNEKISGEQLESLKDALSESDLPIMVDVVDWHAISETFQNIISKQYEVIK